MSETLIAAFSALIALGAALTGYAAHRHQVRRARELETRESLIAARERHAEERALEAERREALVQASTVSVHVRTGPSRLQDGWFTAELVVRNGSDQPIRDLTVLRRGEPLGDASGGLGPGAVRSFLLPVMEGPVAEWNVLRDIEVDFTDAADIRWRRESGGSLRRGSRRAEDGTWQWGGPQEPIVRVLPPVYAQPTSPAPFGVPPNARARSSRPGRVALAVLLAAVLAAVLILRVLSR